MLNKILIPFLCIGLYACHSETDASYEKEIEGKLSADLVRNPNTLSGTSTSAGSLRFTDTLHHFGRLKDGEKVQYNFEYQNTGQKDIIIFSAKASCGCTVAEFNDKPIKPGEKGEMLVTFNSSDKKGHNKKSVVVMTS